MKKDGEGEWCKARAQPPTSGGRDDDNDGFSTWRVVRWALALAVAAALGVTIVDVTKRATE